MAEKVICVYAIKNLVTGEAYVGGTVNLSGRWSVHKTFLKQGRHYSKLLQEAWDEYGASSFWVEVLELTDEEHLVEREQYYIDTLSPAYNFTRTAGPVIRDPEVDKKRMSALIDYNKNVRDYSDPEYRRKQSEAHLGKPLSESHRRRISEIQKGRKLSDEWKENVSKAMKGNPNVQGPKSESHRKSMSRVTTSKWQDPEWRAKVIAAQNEGKRKRKEKLAQENSD